ncbi:hypothetical protein SDC9_35869 [bioreactor metagenome]|uniref:DUF2108 domain-containing protein n=1 Tax=bioreactor metagenome TaxID=1076179 RepID=A0A644VF24_9ZZZZ|nr:DUF2108 domain-containing protein [Methanocorpusculum sp.]
MTGLFLLLAAFLALFGGMAALIVKSAFDKLICLGILTAGVVLFVVERGYLDVAIVISLLMPVGTIFILLLLGKKREAAK